MDIAQQTTWQRKDCVSADVDGSLVLLDLDTLVYHSLNVTASAIWTALEQPSSAAAISEQLQQRFAVDPDHCGRAVTRLLGELRAKNLISELPAQPPAPR